MPFFKCSMYFVVCAVYTTFAGCNAWEIVIKVSYFIFQCREVCIDTICKVTNMVFPTSFEFKAFVIYFTSVYGGLVCINLGNRIDFYKKVFCVFVVIVKTYRQAVVQETHVKAEVQLFGCLPFEIWIGESRRIRAVVLFGVVSVLVPGCIVANRCGVWIVVEHINITVTSPRCTELQEGDNIAADIFFNEFFITDSPTYGQRREFPPTFVNWQFGSIKCISTVVELQAITVVECIEQTTKVGETG